MVSEVPNKRAGQGQLAAAENKRLSEPGDAGYNGWDSFGCRYYHPGTNRTVFTPQDRNKRFLTSQQKENQ